MLLNKLILLQEIVILSNTDIYFDNSLQLVKNIDLNNKVLCLLHNVDSNVTLIFLDILTSSPHR